uniref:non-specific serine/threonine protein kinase n=1 Tax=viral metagenome TaxID=1070528 RepID=A0A6C0EHV8_9ZZZZ
MKTINDLNNKYKIIKKIGSGAFGDVYKGLDKNTKKFVAIKIDKQEINESKLNTEFELYQTIHAYDGIASIIWKGVINNKNIFIMEYLGPNLDDLFDFCGNKFSIKTVIMIGIQLLDRIELLHNNNILHRDIKPDNFLIGSKSKKNTVYIIDFGLSKKYKNESGEHVEYRKTSNFTGSYRYCSIRNHKGIEQSRRDDLESIGYMLIFFLKGKLPWQGLKSSNIEKRQHIKNIFEVKRNTSIDELCSGIPIEFLNFIKYVRTLRFNQIPNYNYLKSLLLNIFTRYDYEFDNVFDWTLKIRKRNRDKQRELDRE